MKQFNKLLKKVDKFQQSHQLTAFSYAVIKKYGQDRTGYQAALLTYYGFLALFPLLMILTTLLDLAAGSNSELEKTVITGLTDYFPVLGNQLAGKINALGGSGFALTAGLLFALYGTRGVADVLQGGIQKVWGYDKRQSAGWPLGALKSVAIVVVAGLGFILASIISGWAAAAGQGWEFRVLTLAINLFLLFWLFTFLIKACLPKHVGLKEIRFGAAAAAIGLVILQAAGSYILARQLRNLDALYSYFAVTLGLLFWIYLQSQMLYYSVTIAAVQSKKLWPRSLDDKPSPKAN